MIIATKQPHRTFARRKRQHLRVWLQDLLWNAPPALCWFSTQGCYRLRFLTVISELRQWYQITKRVRQADEIFDLPELTIYGILTEQHLDHNRCDQERVVAFTVIDDQMIARLHRAFPVLDGEDPVRSTWEPSIPVIADVFGYDVGEGTNTIVNPWQHQTVCRVDRWVRWSGVFFAMRLYVDGSQMLLKTPRIFPDLPSMIAQTAGIIPYDAVDEEWVMPQAIGYPDEFHVWKAFHQDPGAITALLALSS